MATADDIAFLENFRVKIDAFLVAGEAPTQDPLWGGRDLLKMKEAMKDPAFRALRQDINKMKGQAAQILERLSIRCTFEQYPPPAVGGPTLKIPLFDLIVENRSVHTLDGTVFTDKIDEAIGRLQSESDTSTPGPSLPVLVVRDLSSATAFYGEKLGYSIQSRDDVQDTVILARGAARLILTTDGAAQPGIAFVETSDLYPVTAEFAERGITVRDTTLNGITGFEIADPDGNRLLFGRVDEFSIVE